MREERTQHGRESVFFPLLLITIGFLLLGSRMGLIPGDAGDIFGIYWPLIFVIGAIDNLYHDNDIIGPILWGGLGILLVAANLSLVEFDFWNLTRLWPLLLVAIGMELILRSRRNLATNLLRAVVGLGMLAMVAFFIFGGVINSSAVGTTTQEISQRLDGAKTASVDVNASFGQVYFSGGAEPATLVSGTARYPQGENVTIDYRKDGQNGKLYLDSQGYTMIFPFMPASSHQWKLKFNETVPLSLSAMLPMGKMEIDAEELKLEDLSAEVALGSLRVNLPEEGDFSGSLKTAMGSMTIVVPEGAAVEFELNKAVTSVSYPDGYERDGDVVRSQAAEKGGSMMRLTLDVPMGSVVIREAK